MGYIPRPQTRADIEAEQQQYQQQQFDQSASAPIPGYGTWNGQVRQQGQPGWMGNSTPPQTNMRLPGANSLITGLLAQHMNDSMTSEQWRGLLPAMNGQVMQQQQPPMMIPGYYGRQAMGMAGLLSPSTGDTYPNGMKRPFRPGGK